MALTLALCFLTVALPTARAHQSTGVIAGRVVMEDGSAMPGVMVFVSGGPLDRPLVATTTQNGEFRFPRLGDGTYAIAFQLSGFAWSAVRDVRVESARVTDVGRVVMRIDRRQFNNVDAFWLIHFVTSEGAFDLAIPSPDGCNGSVCVSTGSPLTLGSFFMGSVFLRAYDNGTIQPESATDPGGLVIYSTSGKRSEALHVLEDDRVTTDPDGKYPVGRISRRTGDDDTVAAIRKLKRIGSEFARPVIIYSARLPGEPAPPAREQSPSGAIGGRFVDNAGAVMPGVSVTVSGAGAAAPTVVTTRIDGTFRASALPDGTYAITAALSGFAPVEARDVVVANGGLTDLGTILMPLNGRVEPDLKTMGLRPNETAIQFATSGGNFELAIGGDTRLPDAAAAFVARIKHRVYDGGTLQPILDSRATGPPSVKALAFVPAPTATTPAEPVYLVGQNIATNAEGTNVIGRVWRLFELRDSAIAAASRLVGGDERPTPIFIVRAALMIFLTPAPAPSP